MPQPEVVLAFSTARQVQLSRFKDGGAPRRRPFHRYTFPHPSTCHGHRNVSTHLRECCGVPNTRCFPPASHASMIQKQLACAVCRQNSNLTSFQRARRPASSFRIEVLLSRPMFCSSHPAPTRRLLLQHPVFPSSALRSRQRSHLILFGGGTRGSLQSE